MLHESVSYRLFYHCIAITHFCESLKADLTVQIVLSTLQTIGLLVGIGYYIMTLNYTRRNQEQTLKTRSMTFYHNIAGQILSNKEVMEYMVIIEDNPVSSAAEFGTLWENNHDYRIAFLWWLNFYETLGDYVREGIVDIGLFARRALWFNLRFWEMYKPVIYANRNQFGPSFYSNTEFLMDSLLEYLKEHPEISH